MDDDTPICNPGSSSGEDATHCISLEDCDERNNILSLNLTANNRKRPSQPFQQKMQHRIFTICQTSVFSPRSWLPASTVHHSFLKNQLPVFPALASLRARAQPIEREMQQQSYRTEPPSAIFPQQYFPAAMETRNLFRKLKLPDHPAELQTSIQLLREQLQQHNLKSMQTFSFLPPIPLPVTLPNNTFFQNQGHLQGGLIYQPPQTTQLRANQAMVIPPEKVRLSEADPYMVVLLAAAQWQYRGNNQQQSYRQKRQPHPQFHSSAAVNSQLPFISTERQISTSKEIYGGQPAESNPEQMLTLEDIQQLRNNLENIRKSKYLTQSDVASLLSKRLREEIHRQWISRLENFDNYFENMCQIKRLLECLMDSYKTSQSTTDLLANNTETNVSGLQTQDAIDTTSEQFRKNLVCMQNPNPDIKQIAMIDSNIGVEDLLSNNRPGSSTDEVKAHMMSQDGISDLGKESNYVSACLHQEQQVPKDAVNVSNEQIGQFFNSSVLSDCESPPKEQTIPTCSASKKHNSHIASTSKDASISFRSLCSRKLNFFQQPMEPHPEKDYDRRNDTLHKIIPGLENTKIRSHTR